MGLHFEGHKPLLLIFPFDLLSHYLRCLELAKKLRNQYEIQFAYSRSYNHFVEKEGFNYFHCKGFDPVQVMDCVKRFDFSWLNEKDLEDVFKSQLECIRILKPSAVLGDTAPTLKMAAEKTGVLYYSLMNGYMSKYYSHIRKLSRTHPAYKYSLKLPGEVFDFITQKAESIAFYLVHKPFKKLRKKYKLLQFKSYLDELEGDTNLICDLPELFPQKKLPGNYRTISPLFHSSFNESDNLPINLDSSKKTIFVSMGSSGDWEQVKFLNDPYYTKYNIVTAADYHRIIDAPHIIRENFVNASSLFPYTDLVICHGGNGTIYQALSFGVPLLCITSHFEQEWNVHGLERLNLGRSVNDYALKEEMKDIIDLWSQKKNTELFKVFQNKVNQTKATFQVDKLHFSSIGSN
jgi:UDP:flavonoid glycosyltransferase YjiC (YdhE family)